MEFKMIFERRKSLRTSLQLTVDEVSSTHCGQAVITNLSDSGLCYSKPFLKLQETGGEVTFTLPPHSSPFSDEVTGKIVHQYIYGKNLVTGITFSNITDQTKERLNKLLNHKISLKADYNG